MALVKCNYNKIRCECNEWLLQDEQEKVGEWCINGWCDSCTHGADESYAEQITPNRIDYQISYKCGHAKLIECMFEKNTCYEFVDDKWKGFLKIGKQTISIWQIDYLEIDGRVLITRGVDK